MRRPKPSTLPARPHFSSGPCAKPPGWNPALIDTRVLGRSHRSALGKARLQEAIERTHALLRLPPDYRLGIVPASDTGAVEMALWALLGWRIGDQAGWAALPAFLYFGWLAVCLVWIDADVHRLPDGIWMFGGPTSMTQYVDAVVAALGR